ncbi:hypothetical protein A3C96_00570 [Candidatus Uhrbacteria bacterium RIFCSPHIGHO2_02_FULL_60_10]|uniref:DUF4145 domain-containing protein n=1 Tax=Candidatus Uhrbacteria bacterium RIFCSPHIGHO2_02_FULL_60_10 TaxID=1802392 RepID=A0A1F7U9Y1_9BACT|nr:MAG: hypothetical protein A3C96_00570 [Candidatus Uhrbacteria bacterium RIFCSPHIGHO2_02_FULL_60_10]
MTLTIDLASLIKGIGLLVGGGMVLGVLLLLFGQVRRWFSSRKFAAHDLAAMRGRWREIEAMAHGAGEMQRKLAVIEADKLLDLALKSLYMSGNTLGERLKFAEYKYPELRAVWWAHKVRNQLAHEATFHLEAGVARRAIAEFRKALQRLGAI